MKEKVLCSTFRFGSSLRQAFALVIIIHLAAFGIVCADDGKPAAAPTDQPEPNKQPAEIVTPPVAAPPATAEQPAAAQPSSPPAKPAPALQPAEKKQAASAAGAEKLAPVIVTGSLIPTAETVGPAPVETITAKEIQETGVEDVRLLLKRLSTSFTGNGNLGQEVNNGGYGEANLQIRNLPTLILLNGRRLGDSAFSAIASTSGQSQVDVNQIPVAAIERIEVLKDGASALYGSEAIGGVVNIILKKDFTGVEIDGRYGAATGKGDFTEQRASVVTGVSDEHSSFMAGAEYYHEDPLRADDRSIASESIQTRLNKNLAPPGYFSTHYPGRVQDGDGSWILAGSPFAKGAAGYNPTLSTPPVFAGQSFTSVAAYNAYAIAHGYVDPTGHGQGPYLFQANTPQGAVAAPFGEALLNTTLYGVDSIVSQDRRQVFFTGDHDLIGKQLQVFADFLYANNESIGQMAPAPVPGLANANISVPADNVYNPFGIDLGPGGSEIPKIHSRFIQSGPRIFDAQSDYAHGTIGLKGDFESGYSYDAAYNYNRYDETLFTKNAINGAALDLALKPSTSSGAPAGSSQLQTFGAFGNFLPQYDIFFTPTQNYPTTQGPNSSALINALRTTLFSEGIAEEWDAGGVITGNPIELRAGKIGFAAGGGLEDELLKTDFDGLTRIGKVPGLNAQEPTSGTRHSYNLFAEVRVPLTSPDMDLPVFHRLEVTAAGRFESFAPGGDDAVPKVGVRWQPLDDQITLRASYSQSFIAPTTAQLFGGDSQNTPFLSFPDGVSEQSTDSYGSNPGLKAQTAESYSFGLVATPKAIPHLTVSADYYHIIERNVILRASDQVVLDSLNSLGSASPYAKNFFFDDGAQLITTAPNQITSANYGIMRIPLLNGGKTQTEGLDLAANYEVPTKEAGRFNFFVAANVLFNFLYSDPVIGGPYHYEGQYTDAGNGIGGAQGLLPDYQLTTGLTWDIHDFTYAITARYVPEVTDQGDGFPSTTGTGKPGVNDFTVNGKPWTIDSWFDIDMQLSYEFGRHETQKSWYGGTKLTLGINNITDEKPPEISSAFEDNTDKSVYDFIGRFVYVEVSKKF